MSEIVVHDGVLNRDHDVPKNGAVYTGCQDLRLCEGGLDTCCVGEVCVHFFLRAFVEANKLFLKVSRGFEVAFLVS